MEPKPSFTVAAGAARNGIVSVLEGTNYPGWKQEMTSFLQSKGLYKYITPRAAALMTQHADSPDKLEELMEGDEKALGFIKCNILSSYLDVVVNSVTALDAWNKLGEFFAGKESFNKIHLLEQLIDGKLLETGNPVNDIQSFIKEKNEIVVRLNSIGLNISKELQVAIMLSRLPDSYDTMRRIMESQADLTLVKLTSELNREAIRRSKKRPIGQESALFSGAGLPPSKRFKSNHDRKKVHCDYCSLNGHLAGDCWINPKSAKFRPQFRKALAESATSRDEHPGQHNFEG
jgi:hypothetical protein